MSTTDADGPKADYQLEPALGTKMVTLLVGSKRKEFMVHKNLICRASDFFKSAFVGDFQEGQSGTISLAEDNPGAVSLFVDWIYQGVVPAGNTEEYLQNLYDLYLLSDKLCLAEWKDRTMDQIQDTAARYDLTEECVVPELALRVLERTTGRGLSGRPAQAHPR